MKRGPRSAAELNVVSLDVPRSRPRIIAPSSLNAAEKKMFNEVIGDNAHLRSGDSILVAQFVQAVMKASKLARKTDETSVKSWERSSRVMIALATKLRITQQAKTHHITAGRVNANARPQSYYQSGAL